MLASFAKHSLIDLTVTASGDVDVDAHHTVEDVAIVLGDALREALGDKRGISRFGDATVPLDEALVQAVVDVAGRPYCVHTGEPEGQEYVVIGGAYAGSLTRHVFETLAHHAGIALHIRVLGGRDPHHVVEAQFKAVARALRAAVAIDPRVDGHTRAPRAASRGGPARTSAGHPARARRRRRRRLWAERGVSPFAVVPEDGRWTAVLPVGDVTAARRPYDDVVTMLLNRPLPHRLRPAVGVGVVGRRAVLCVTPGGWRAVRPLAGVATGARRRPPGWAPRRAARRRRCGRRRRRPGRRR